MTIETVATPATGVIGAEPYVAGPYVADADLGPSRAAVAWGAVIAGALGAIAFTLVLFSLGSGFGFAAASPWGAIAETAAKVTLAAGVWLIIVQWLSAAVGGYLAGRLRTRWPGLHTHEVFFRDTAHGFLAWALATAVVAGVAATTATLAASGAAATTTAATQQNFAYDADLLYRAPGGDPAALTPARAEAERMLAASVATGGLTPEDHAYLVASVSNRAGVAPAEAERRLDVVTQRESQAALAAQVAADKARKAAATFAIINAIAMLIGAFIAAATAVLGGEIRDRHPV
jgi:hypothetical protein